MSRTKGGRPRLYKKKGRKQASKAYQEYLRDYAKHGQGANADGSIRSIHTGTDAMARGLLTGSKVAK